MSATIKTDVLVIGEGSGGQVAALAASEAGVNVTLLYNGLASATAISTGFLTFPAHDGFTPDEAFEAMSNVTGKNVCDEKLLRKLINESPKEMAAIFEKYDIPVDRAPLGVRVRRSAKSGKALLDDRPMSDGVDDMTQLVMEFSSTHGTSLFSQLRKAVKASNIRRVKGTAIKLTAEGPSVWANIDGKLVKIVARSVILATGGLQGIYEFTDTPQNLLGDGQSMALEIGAELVDMEFIQFYPLAVNEEGVPPIFLYPDYPSTAKLINSENEDIVAKYLGEGQSALAALSNWDILSSIIQTEILEKREVFIDFRETLDDEWASDSLTGTFLGKHLPNFREQLVRIAPSSHYTIGGVRTNENAETSIPGLYAVGEVSGGVHGANRHGGTALVEAMTFGAIAGRHAAANLQPLSNAANTKGEMPRLKADGTNDDRSELLAKVRRAAQMGLGPARKAQLLDSTLIVLRSLREEINALGWSDIDGLYEVSRLSRVVRLAEAMCLCMHNREETRGTHVRSDFPKVSENWKCKQIVTLQEGKIECAILN